MKKGEEKKQEIQLGQGDVFFLLTHCNMLLTISIFSVYLIKIINLGYMFLSTYNLKKEISCMMFNEI